MGRHQNEIPYICELLKSRFHTVYIHNVYGIRQKIADIYISLRWETKWMLLGRSYHLRRADRQSGNSETVHCESQFCFINFNGSTKINIQSSTVSLRNCWCEVVLNHLTLSSQPFTVIVVLCGEMVSSKLLTAGSLGPCSSWLSQLLGQSTTRPPDLAWRWRSAGARARTGAPPNKMTLYVWW